MRSSQQNIAFQGPQEPGIATVQVSQQSRDVVQVAGLRDADCRRGFPATSDQQGCTIPMSSFLFLSFQYENLRRECRACQREDTDLCTSERILHDRASVCRRHVCTSADILFRHIVADVLACACQG